MWSDLVVGELVGKGEVRLGSPLDLGHLTNIRKEREHIKTGAEVQTSLCPLP